MSNSPVIRQAQLADLPRIRYLLRESFLAMLPDQQLEPLQWKDEKHASNMMLKAADGSADTILQELSKESDGAKYLWVATVQDHQGKEDKSVTGLELPFSSIVIDSNSPQPTLPSNTLRGTVVGMIGLNLPHENPTFSTPGELVRMAVDPTLRSMGLGKLLMNQLLSKAKELKLPLVELRTANERAKNFYEKCGFITVDTMSIGPGRTLFHCCIQISLAKFSRYIIVGGTHGNERLGITMCQELRDSFTKAVKENLEESLDDTLATIQKFPSLSTHIVPGNPQAILQCRRYIQQDLNRAIVLEEGDSYESKRAKWFSKTFGRKDAGINSPHNFLVDLHSTTSNVGILIMCNHADVYALRIAHALTQIHNHSWSTESNPSDKPLLRAYLSPGNRYTSPSMDALCPSGLSIEIGPLPHGTFNHSMLCVMRDLLQTIGEILQQHNQFVSSLGQEPQVFYDSVDVSKGWMGKGVPKTQVWERLKENIDYPRTGSEMLDICGYIHPKVQDFVELKPEDSAFLSTVPSTDPTDSTEQVGEKHYKVFKFDAPKEPPSWHPTTPKPLYPVFVGEQAYIERGIAFGLMKHLDRLIV